MDKPKWAQRLAFHRDMERAAQRGMALAVELRCAVEDAGGARCTADARPEHTHRYDVADLP